MRIFFSVGEPSGDVHGANLIAELRRLTSAGNSPTSRGRLEAVGFGGPRMAAAGCRLLEDMTELAVMGLGAVLTKLPRFFALRDRAQAFFRDHRPEAVVLIDYPGFNWHIARAAKEADIPVYYYGLPQLWAWAPWRVRKVLDWVDHALVKLPFEEAWFNSRGCRASYVGHPYFDELRAQQVDHPFLDRLAMQRGRLVTILPGSRTQEVKSNLPQLLKAASLVQREVPGVRLAIASYSDRQAGLAKRIVSRSSVEAEIHVGRTPELILSAAACLACSGSVSLELLYHAVPSVILYCVPIWSYVALRQLVKVRYITLVNLLATDYLYADDQHPAPYDRNQPGHEDVLLPEYPTWRDRSADLAAHLIEWLTDDSARKRASDRLAELRDRIATGGASARAAEYILRHLLREEQPTIAVPATGPLQTYRKAS
jgi:lipid-A-disaccharide synthase